MRHLRLSLPALALVVAGSWATQGTACDKDKATSASAAAGKSAVCTAQMASQCTPEMAAACKASGMKTASGASCSASRTSAKSAAFTASASSCASKTSAATAAYDHCAAARSAAVTASASGCASKTSAATAAAYDHCAGKGAKSAAVTASAIGAGDARAKTTAIAAGSHCSGNGMANVAGRTSHADCDACADMSMCYEELEAAGARSQVVPLKNGVMFVYTAETPGKVNALQSAMSRRSEHLAQIISAGDKAHLCPECKSLRGAIASGKMSREVVNIEGGALTLMTSSDPTVVAKIHAMVDSHKNGRAKI